MTETQTARAVDTPAPEARQFDFWLGDWDVTWGDGERARNRVEAILDGGVVQENFDGAPSSPLKGMSLSVYSASQRLWHQTWVDNSRNYWSFSGGWQGDRMVLGTTVERDGRPVRLRMVWFNIRRDSLDWHWERSDDEGQTWSVLWHLRYTRRAAA
jgi:hypothetical protein